MRNRRKNYHAIAMATAAVFSLGVFDAGSRGIFVRAESWVLAPIMLIAVFVATLVVGLLGGKRISSATIWLLVLAVLLGFAYGVLVSAVFAETTSYGFVNGAGWLIMLMAALVYVTGFELARRIFHH